MRRCTTSCSLPIQVMTTGPLPAPSKCKSGLPRITETCPGWWKLSFRLRLWSLVWFQVRTKSWHLKDSKSAWKSTPKWTWMCFVWSYVENITNMTSHNTNASLIAAIHRVFAELPPALMEKHAPSSGSVSRQWLRLKAATLNRCQLYYIIKLPKLIFSIKVLN